MERKQTRNTLSDFRFNLFSIHQFLSDKDIKDLVYLSPECECPKDIQGGREYFEQLEGKGLISPSNYDYLLDRLTHIRKEDLATQLMLHSSQSQHTPSSLSDHLSACLLNSLQCRVQRLPSGFSEPSLTLTMVYTAKQGICKAHTEAIEKLCDSSTLNKVRGLLEAYLCQSVLQSTKIDMEATVYQWSSFSVFVDRGMLGELLENTLESTYSFFDAFCTNIGTVLDMETIQVQSIEPSAKACILAFDRFSEALADIEWNQSTRQDAINRKTSRVFQVDIQGQSACEAIADICDGLPCVKSVEGAERSTKEELFTINTSMYACWCSTPMYHWMRTLIQIAASSKLDMTMYHDNIMKIVSEHREPIIKCYSIFTQLLGKDVMKMVDPVLNMPQQTVPSERPTTTPTTDNYTMVEYMTVYMYMYLLQLVALTGSSSSSQWEMAERFASIHQVFHENYYAQALKSSMEVARKIITATHAQVKNFKQHVIQLCPNSLAERFLISKLLSDVDTHK